VTLGARRYRQRQEALYRCDREGTAVKAYRNRGRRLDLNSVFLVAGSLFSRDALMGLPQKGEDGSEEVPVVIGPGGVPGSGDHHE
jgi:hypothetical protein